MVSTSACVGLRIASSVHLEQSQSPPLLPSVPREPWNSWRHPALRPYARAWEGRIMRASGLDVFDRTLQTTHVWLNELMDSLGSDRQAAWHVLGAVLHALRDRLPPGLAAHLGAQLPLLVRGLYYDQ